MVFILTDQIYDEATGGDAFARYLAYLATVGDRMPPGARALATSDWYFDSRDHRAPHDAWLEHVELTEMRAPDGGRSVRLRVRLLGAYHDGHIVLTYRDVSRYRIERDPRPRDATNGQGDWRHHEFRVTVEGRLEHEIEWWGTDAIGSWIIEAADVEYEWFSVTGPGH